MNRLHPARIGAAVRQQLTQLGMGTRLFGRLLALMGPALGRPRLIGDQIHAKVGIEFRIWFRRQSKEPSCDTILVTLFDCFRG